MPGVAPCVVYFASCGGRFDERGRPVFGDGVPMNCPWGAFDCAGCELMQGWLAALSSQGVVATWECTECAGESLSSGAKLPGYFQSGRDPFAAPDDKWKFDKDEPVVCCCDKCGWETSFLQLVLRPKGTDG